MKKLKLCLLLIGLGDCCIAASSTMPIDEVQQRHLRNGMSTATGEASASRETVVHTVTNVPGPVAFDFKSADHKLVADTMHQTEYPEDIGDPLFWFDCRQTNGWTFAANGEVAKIPNLTDDGRYLSTDTEGGIHGNAWTSKNPVFVENDAVIGAPVLDFGPKGSLRAMSFNKVGPEGAQTNMLDGIGSVVAVWYSSIGSSSYGGVDGNGTGDWGEGGYYGGAILGGGFGSDGSAAASKSQYVLYRGVPNSRQYEISADINRPRWYDNPFANGSHTHIAIRNGHISHNGQHTHPAVTGFAGGWEVVSVLPQTVAPLFNATGLGMNDSRISAVSGGFKVAEMLIFGKILTEEETARVEAYLQRKWFGRDAFGVNGNAFLSRARVFRLASGRLSGDILPVEVKEGEKLTIGELRGGRGFGNASIVKSGAGKLEILDASRYGGEVRVEEGELEFSPRRLPQALPGNAFLHFDASSAESFVTNSAGEFVLFRNLAGKSSYKVHEICARPSGTVAPEILSDEFGPGKHALDFGDYVKEDFTRYLMFATNETEEVSSVIAKPSAIVTVVAVVGAQRGGGGLLMRDNNVGYFARVSSIPAKFDSVFLGTYSSGNDLPANKHVTLMIDALPVDGSKSGYLHAGYQVIAVRAPGHGASRGIGGLPWGSGGLRLCEFVAWNHPLTDDEMRDASALLMDKWFGKTAPGYGSVDGEIKKLVAAGDVKINVASGVARVGDVSVDGGSIEKTGAGVLEYENIAMDELTVSGGTVRRRALNVVQETAALASRPSLHLDASDAASMRIENVEGENRIYEWYSQGDKTVSATVPFRIGNESNDTTKYTTRKYAPYLSDDVTLNGKATVDFGPFTTAQGGRAFTLSRSFDAVRSAYVVWAPRDDTRGAFFGCSKGTGDGDANKEFYDFLRNGETTNSAELVMSNATSDHIREGAIFTNGVAVSATVVPKAGAFMLAEFHPAAPAHVSAIGTDRDVDRFSGGIRVAEVVLYERKLTEREKIATRNYLMAKWFNAEPQALPEEQGQDDFERFNIAGDAEFSVDGETGIDRLCGKGAFVKTGADVLSLVELCAFTGAVTVAEGALKLAGRRPRRLGSVAAQDSLIFHADATSGISAATNANGRVDIAEWKSKLDDGWTAIPFYDDHRPTLIKADDLGGNHVVDMGKKGDIQAFRFAKDGVTNLLENIGSVFWMIGSHNGGGYLLGGGRHYSNWDGGRFNFNRGGDEGGKGDKPGKPILSSTWTTPFNIKSAIWRMDGVEIDPLEEGLSGGWDLISMNITNNTYRTTNADGFAFDGRAIEGGHADYMGCQRLAEVLIYNRALTDEETAEVEAYLAHKWRFRGTNAQMTNFVDFAVAEGATLDLGGESQYARSISGSGTLRDGTIAAGELVIDASVDGRLAFDSATLSIEPGMRIVVRNPGLFRAGSVIPVVECPVAGLENLGTCTVEFDANVPDSVRPRLKYRNGMLAVVLAPAPTFMIIR